MPLTRQYRIPILDRKEHFRLNEVLFFLLITKIINKYPDYTAITHFIDACSELFHCNALVINRILMKIVSRDMSYCPRRYEIITILYRAKLPGHAIIKLTGYSKIMIYRVIRQELKDPTPITPRGTADEAREIKKFLLGLKVLGGIL